MISLFIGGAFLVGLLIQSFVDLYLRRRLRDEAYIEGARFGLKAGEKANETMRMLGSNRATVVIEKGKAKMHDTLLIRDPLPMPSSMTPEVVERINDLDGTKFPALRWDLNKEEP